MRKTQSVEFFYELPSGDSLCIQTNVYPGCNAHINCLPEDATPAEPATAEIERCYIGWGDDTVGEPFDPEGLWFRKWASTEMIEVTTDIQNKAIDAYAEQNDGY